jgi:hypothetical protein
LFKYVQDYLIEKQTNWVQQNFVLVLHTVFKLSSCRKLQNYCIESICENPHSFITSKCFPYLDKDILYELLKRDDLRIEEIVTWDCLIKWGIEQTPGLDNNRTKWNDNNYEALKNTLSRFIPLIRFVDISAADFFDKVRPYKAIIPHYLYEEVSEFYYKNTLPKTTTLPSRGGGIQIRSNLIGPKLANIISNWIEGKSEKNLLSLKKKYKFDLLYRGSRDGISSLIFRSKCNYQGPCVVLVKRSSSKIYGGYDPLGFIPTDYMTPPTVYNVGHRRITKRHKPNVKNTQLRASFIFSFKNSGRDVQMSRDYADDATYKNNNYGFNFHNAFYMDGQYVVITIDCVDFDGDIFIPEEIEAFKVVVS